VAAHSIRSPVQPADATDDRSPARSRRMTISGAIVNLNHPAHVVHWHFFQMSVSNIVVICVMLLVFALAILLPFPGAARRQAAREAGGRA
jgi:hypothetical protein